MVMRRGGEVQGDLVVTWAEMPRSPGHAFYDKLQKLLNEAGFDGFVETICKPFYAPRMGAPSLPPGRYFRMHMVGYFEGIDSERGIAWRCSDSFSLRDFLRLAQRDKVPDHSWLSKTRSRLPHEVHEQVFGWVLNLVAERGLVKGERIGIDASTMEAKPTHGFLRWHGDEAARDAVYANRARLKSGVGQDALRRRGEMVESSFAHVLDRGGMRRAWLRARKPCMGRLLSRLIFNLFYLFVRSDWAPSSRPDQTLIGCRAQ
jgi:transposase